MNAVLAVIGKDSVGILSGVSTKCAEFNANIIDVSQTVMSSIFTMVMIVNIDSLYDELTVFANAMKEYGKEKNLEIYVMHEDIFNSMHKI